MKRYNFKQGESCIVAAAIHNGHQVRPELLPFINLTEQQRSREEDPYTIELTKIADNRITVSHSRFEVDLNRPPEKAVYREPKDAWGLDVWKQPLSDELAEKSLQFHEEFYSQLRAYINELLRKHSYIAIYDIHSYNHRREGPDVYADPEENPEVNIGTGYVDQGVWRPVLDTFMNTMSEYNYEGRTLDVRENVKFEGGYFSKWLHDNYGEFVCPIAIEFKKFFMDEWTNEVNNEQLIHLKEMLISTLLPVQEKLNQISKEAGHVV